MGRSGPCHRKAPRKSQMMNTMTGNMALVPGVVGMDIDIGMYLGKSRVAVTFQCHESWVPASNYEFGLVQKSSIR